MKTAVAETSLAAYRSLSAREYLQPKERAVMEPFTGPEVRLSRQQISERLPMPINCVCGRVDSLLAGLTVFGYFADQVHYLRAAEREASMPMLFDLEAADADQMQEAA